MNEKNIYDAIIIGGGPAGLSAAIYLARARYRVLVLEKETFGGQITITSEVVNYPGIEKTDGKYLTQVMRRQGEKFGAEFSVAEVRDTDLTDDIKTVKTDKGVFSSFGVLIATGARPRTLGFPGEEKFKGHGVAYCATCDGEFFTGKEIFVIGGGFAAAEESVFLTRYAKHVTVLVREDDFTCAAAVAEKAKENTKITVLPNTEVVSVEGSEYPNKITYKNNKTGKETTFESKNDTFGVFVFVGYEPASELVANAVATDKYGYILTDKTQKTNIDGVYAAGDVCEKTLRQVVTAVSDGATAATELEKYAAAMQRKTGFKPKNEPAVNKTAQTPETKKLFDDKVTEQLDKVFEKMKKPLTLKLHLDKTPKSEELRKFVTELAVKTEKLNVTTAENSEEQHKPFVEILTADVKKTGLGFHGVPTGHEFTPFILGLLNASSDSGLKISAETEQKIKSLPKTDMKILVTLTCSMCPELVTAAQKTATINENITAEVYDVSLFPDLREKYKIMSVPCLVVNENDVSFGKKDIDTLIDFLINK